MNWSTVGQSQMLKSKITPQEFHPKTAGSAEEFSLPDSYAQSAFRTARVSPQLTVTQSRCTNDQNQTTLIGHNSPCAMLIFGLEGRVEFTLSGTKEIAIVGSQEAWFFAPDEHTLMRRQLDNEAASMFVVRLDLANDQGLYPEFCSKLENLDRRMQRLDAEPHLSDAMRDFLLQPTENVWDLLIKEGRCLELFGIVFRHIAGQHEGLSDQDIALYQKCSEILLRRLDDPPTLEALASQCDTNHVRLNGVFTRKTGKTVFAYHRQLRLQRAADELREGGRSITEIAHDLGFSSSSHLTTAFSKEYGKTPRQYRLAHRQPSPLKS